MKNLIVIIAFLMASTTSFAQSVFDKFEVKEGIASVVVSKKMFEIMSKVKIDAKDKDMQQYMNLLKKLDNLKVFTTSNSKLGADLKTSVTSYLKSNPLEELMRANGDGKNVKIYVKSGANDSTVKELLMFVEGANMKDANTIVLSLTGNFNLDEIDYALMEVNGNISFLPKEKEKPVTKKDMKIKCNNEGLTVNAIIDSKYMANNMKAINKDKEWLDHELKVNGYDNYDNILLATIDNNYKVTIYEKNVKPDKNTVLE